VPVYRLDRRIIFPPADHAEEGLLAVGGDLSPARLLLAYRSGIFPWYDDRSPILWHSPEPRCVFELDKLHVSRSLRRTLKLGRFDVRHDEAFSRVIRACKEAPRGREESDGLGGTWITDDMEEAYTRLHELGHAHSIESYRDGELAGGLYGVTIGQMFFGESMFAWQPDASKVALVTVARRLLAAGASFMDSQVRNPLTLALGAVEWPRALYLRRLAVEVERPEPAGLWSAPWTEVQSR
jgi:leucyl/phenylalanyl-tRNA--protein transferase